MTRPTATTEQLAPVHFDAPPVGVGCSVCRGVVSLPNLLVFRPPGTATDAIRAAGTRIPHEGRRCDCTTQTLPVSASVLATERGAASGAREVGSRSPTNEPRA